MGGIYMFFSAVSIKGSLLSLYVLAENFITVHVIVKVSYDRPPGSSPKLFQHLKQNFPTLPQHAWWISLAYVHYGGYLGQMCITMVDILGKCAIP